jgi:hypothetical protein
MKTGAFRKIDVAVLVALSLIILALGASLVQAQTSAASDLGSGWTCHKLPIIEVCNHTT